jgi:hypothetical protein
MTDTVTGSQSAPIAYEAVPVDFLHLGSSYGPNYVDSVYEGEKALRKALSDFWSTCPTTYVIVAGYGQGAQVAGDVVEALTSKQRSRIAALLLFGDPRFNPKDKRVNVPETGYSRKLSGSFQVVDKHMRQIPQDLKVDTRSYCLAGDPVCNLSATNLAGCLANCAHFKYEDDGWTELAAFWAITHWRQLIPLK